MTMLRPSIRLINSVTREPLGLEYFYDLSCIPRVGDIITIDTEQYNGRVRVTEIDHFCDATVMGLLACRLITIVASEVK